MMIKLGYVFSFRCYPGEQSNVLVGPTPDEQKTIGWGDRSAAEPPEVAARTIKCANVANWGLVQEIYESLGRSLRFEGAYDKQGNRLEAVTQVWKAASSGRPYRRANKFEEELLQVCEQRYILEKRVKKRKT